MASRFKFTLEPALKHRKVIEEQRQRDLANILRHRATLEERIRGMQQQISHDKRAMAQGLIGAVDVNRVRQHGFYQGQVAVSAQQLLKELLAVHGMIERARIALLGATRDRKAIEALRDRQYQQWLAAQRKAETNALDELATQAYARRGDKEG